MKTHDRNTSACDQNLHGSRFFTMLPGGRTYSGLSTNNQNSTMKSGAAQKRRSESWCRSVYLCCCPNCSAATRTRTVAEQTQALNRSLLRKSKATLQSTRDSQPLLAAQNRQIWSESKVARPIGNPRESGPADPTCCVRKPK